MDGFEVPSFFICPISLEIMKDPVTLSTGMTFDRESIQRWLFVYGRRTCPITKQPLADVFLTPNSTLLRLIQQWHVNHSSKVVITRTNSTLHPTFDLAILPKLIKEVKEHETRIKSLKRIKLLIQENDSNRRCIEEAGLFLVIASLISEMDPQRICSRYNDDPLMAEEAINILHLLKPSPDVLKKVAEANDGNTIRSLAVILQRGSYQGRFHSMLLLKSIFKVVDEKYKCELQKEFFEAMVEILKDQNSNRATMAVLSILVEVAPCGSNRIKAVDEGMVGVLVELLAESNDKRSSELMLAVLEILCARAEGRSAFVPHAVSLAAIVGKILTVSQVGNDLAVKILFHVCSLSASNTVVQEMMEVGGVVRLCMVVQAEGSKKTKHKAEQILALHLKAWSKSPCFPVIKSS
ncbi:E3 ubiquitin-protein ligase PUB23-like [Aristolochia californica]|uniref:E3 ubiquitin-protein ligase PUB23-like n=1 Tax=Aristolochia californica TaxID=171875 RepID=UPI0035DDC3FB